MAVKVVKKYCTKNDCYKTAGKRGSIVGLIVHTPAVIDQGAIIKALSGSGGGWFKRWNKAGIKKLADGVIDDTGVYDFAPHTLACWHIGTAYGNSHFIGYELCETLSRSDFAKTWNNAVEHYANLCKQYGLTEKNIYGHCEAHARGWASNHSDPEPYFRRFGKNMNNFREDVKKKLSGQNTSTSTNTGTAAPTVTKTYNPWAYAKVCGLTPDDPCLNVRTGPGTEHLVARQLANGNEVDVICLYSNGWAKINIVDRQYYVYAGYLNIAERQQAAQKPSYAAWVGQAYNLGGSRLNVRTGPGTGYGLLSSWPYLGEGNRVDVIGESGDWYRIRIAGKHEGYAHKNYIKKV